MLGGIIMGLPMVLLPAQILLVNLVTDSLPAIALGLEPAESSVMKKPPRKEDDSFFSGGLMWHIVIRGLLIGICTLASFTVLLTNTHSLVTARTGALITLVLSQLIHVFECKSEEKSLFKIPIFNNIKLVLAAVFSLAILLCAIYVPFCNVIFTTAPLPAKYILRAVLCSFVAPVLSALLFNVLLKPKRQVQWVQTPEK